MSPMRIELPFTTESSGPMESSSLNEGRHFTRWVFEEGRKRTVMSHEFQRDDDDHYLKMVHHLTSLDMPDMLFGIVMDRHSSVISSVYAYDAAMGVPVSPDQDGVASDSMMGGGWICMGNEAARKIVSGELDPVDAYWLTSFDHKTIRDVLWLSLADRKRREGGVSLQFLEENYMYDEGLSG